MMKKIINRFKSLVQNYGYINLFRMILLRPFFILKRTKYTYLLDPERVITKKFENNFKKINTLNIKKVGNYYLDLKLINNSSIVYSLGVGSYIDFDLELNKLKGCSIHLFDPTPKSIRFMKKYSDNKSLIYTPIGIWDENKNIDFYFDSDLKNEADSASILNLSKSSKKFTAKCQTIPSTMESFGHKEIDLLKLDIEGAAIPVLFNMIENKIFPKQIVGEFERPKKDLKKTKKFLSDLNQLILLLEKNGYESYKLPRDKFPYFSIEMLFIKK